VQPIRGISVLVRAISKIQLSPSQLTSIHADLCKVYCLTLICFVMLVTVVIYFVTYLYYDAIHWSVSWWQHKTVWWTGTDAVLNAVRSNHCSVMGLLYVCVAVLTCQVYEASAAVSW